MKSLYLYLTDEEKETWRDTEGSDFQAFKKKMDKKYYGPIYKAFDNLPREVRNGIKETIEVGKRISECMYEIGDAYVSDLRKLSDNCYLLRELVDKEQRE